MPKTAMISPAQDDHRNVSSSVFSWAIKGFAGIAILGLAACAQAPQLSTKKEAPPLVFPLPPDEARFIYERTIRSSRDVDTSIAPNTIEELLTGKGSSAKDIPLRKPYAIAVHQGRLFVSEPTTGIVKVFDAAANKYFTIGNEEPGRLAMPIGLDVDGAGNLYVADITARAVMVYDRDGNFLRKLAGAKIGEEPLFQRLTSVAVDKKGEKIYAVDIGGTNARATQEVHRVRVFDAKSGKHLWDIGKRGSGPGEFNLARDAVIDSNNNLVVVDGGNFRVQVLTADGKFVREFGRLGLQLGDFSRPKEVGVDPANNIYVVDTGFGNFQIFTPEGKLLMSIGSGGNEDTPARYRLLSGIAVDEDGRVYIVDQLFKKIDIFRPATLGPQEGYLASGKKAENASALPANKNSLDERTVPNDTADDALTPEVGL